MPAQAEDSNWLRFVDKCSQIKDKKELATFFDIFFTLSEKDELAKRFAIIRELSTTNKTQREIAKDLGVSLANVSRGANVLKVYSSSLKFVRCCNS